MDFWRNFSRSGRMRQLWKNLGQMCPLTTWHSPNIQKNYLHFNIMQDLKVSPVTSIHITSTKICIYEGNSSALLQNFLQLLPFHTMFLQTFHNQPYWQFKTIFIKKKKIVEIFLCMSLFCDNFFSYTTTAPNFIYSCFYM